LFGKEWPQAHQRFLELHDQNYLDQTTPLTGAETLLDWLLDRNMKVGIVTNKGQHRAEAQLARLGWADKVMVIVGYLDSRPGKPDPLPIHLACQSMQVGVQHTVLIGDGPADMEAASRASSFPVGLTDLFTIDEMQNAGARLCFPDLDQVRAWLRQLHLNL